MKLRDKYVTKNIIENNDDIQLIRKKYKLIKDKDNLT